MTHVVPCYQMPMKLANSSHGGNRYTSQQEDLGKKVQGTQRLCSAQRKQSPSTVTHLAQPASQMEGT